ncbi:terpenoid synthase [Dendrothele bispora CBS 962.96]|uniref:Terpenoid synthase n=1 Tax=Dendrothele bispora (strain CBS 962.96) TaxID=1314807 RepID=A0A4V4HB54_DENBC|nr:terpenoid synthase [Dendrothele bispora CBS 962.96]
MPGLPATDKTSLADVQDVARSFLTRSEFNYPRPTQELTDKFYKSAVEESNRRGITMESKAGKHFLGPCLLFSVRMTTTTYAHLENKATQMLLCIFIACTFYMDDAGQLENREDIEKFHERFFTGQPQPDPVLAALGDVLREMHQHFGRMEANIIVTSALNLYSSVILEFRTEELKIKATEPSYAAFYRTMSGATDAFGFFIFPPSLPVSEYIQAMPDLAIVENHTNDILSFYKEEKAGDDMNYVTLLATTRKISKLEALRLLVDECISSHENILRILAPSKNATAIYQKFFQGYLAFHVYTERYKLNELGF